MEKIVVEDAVPLVPVLRGRRKSKYPFDDLAAPQNEQQFPSFFVPNKTVSAIQSAAARYMRSPSGEGKQLTVRGVVEKGVPGVRVWRVK